jgi:hypothetical protein
MTKEELKQSLATFPEVDADKIVVSGNCKLLAQIVVRTFDQLDEAERQERAYKFPRQRFSEDDMQSIDFILTNAASDPLPSAQDIGVTQRYAHLAPDVILGKVASARAARSETTGANLLRDWPTNWSHLRDLNSRPTVYETVALPLS